MDLRMTCIVFAFISFKLPQLSFGIVRSKLPCLNLVKNVIDNGICISFYRYGTGKSGVFVGMDYLIQLIKNGDTHVDLFNLAHILISNREKLIENEVSFLFSQMSSAEIQLKSRQLHCVCSWL